MNNNFDQTNKNPSANNKNIELENRVLNFNY